MCGRYSITTAPEAMRRLFRFVNPAPDLPPRYNAAPTDKLPVVRLDRDGNRELAVLRWGLIPFWTKDEKVGFKSINARAETVITGQPNSLTAELHDRMPVILEPDHWDTWLAARDMVAMQAMLQPFPAQLMRAYPVSLKVGNVKNDTPDLIEPLGQEGEPRRDLFG